MSDIEHELLGEIERVGDRRADWPSSQRALLAARAARDGRHEPWIDEALAEVERELATD